MQKLRLALIAGGRSDEREVSLNGARGVEQALNRDRYEVVRYDPATDLKRLAAEADDLDFAFILLHGLFGEDGTIQGFLDMLSVPYQGAGVLGSALAMDKNLAKQLYRSTGLPVAPWLMAKPEDVAEPERLLAGLELPLVVKPVRQGSSIGMSIVRESTELPAALEKGFAHDREVMVEAYVKGRELTVGVLGNRELQALPLVEIIPDKRFAFFDYEAKYVPGASAEICPAEVPVEVRDLAQEYARKAHSCLRLSGCSRTDMILGDNGLMVLETNTIPGMTPTSLLPQAAAAAGLDFSALLDRLIELGIEERGQRMRGLRNG